MICNVLFFATNDTLQLKNAKSVESDRLFDLTYT